MIAASDEYKRDTFSQWPFKGRKRGLGSWAAFPPHIRNLVGSMQDLTSFLRDSGYDMKLISEERERYRSPEIFLDAFINDMRGRGIADFMVDDIRTIHTSPSFNSHASTISVAKRSLRVPKLTSLIASPGVRFDGRLYGAHVANRLNLTSSCQIQELNFYLNTFLFPEVEGHEEEVVSALVDLSPYVLHKFYVDYDKYRLPPRTAGRLLFETAKYFSQTRYFGAVVEAAERLELLQADNTDLVEEMMSAAWYAAFRQGRYLRAHQFIDTWERQNPHEKSALVARAITSFEGTSDVPPKWLRISGAHMGRSTYRGNIIYCERLLEQGRLERAEMIARLALQNVREGSVPYNNYSILLHNILSSRGIKSNALESGLQRYTSIKIDPYDLSANHSDNQAVDAEFSVAVVMTAYNAAAFLSLAAGSVLSNLNSRSYLIIVDDSSDDETENICGMMANADDRIRIVRNDENVGTYVSKNRGIKIARALGVDFIGLCDSDDIWLPGHLKSHLSEMCKSDNIKCSSSLWVRLTEQGCVEMGLRGGYVESCPHSTLFRAEIFDEIGFFDAVRFGADRELLARLAIRYGRGATVQIQKLLTLGRRHGKSLTTHGAGLVGRNYSSPHRETYWKAWNEWHLSELSQLGSLPTTNGEVSDRPFEVPYPMLP